VAAPKCGPLRLLSDRTGVRWCTTRITKGVEFRNDTLEISLRTPGADAR
jgi:hypothetical protein